jgi:hypothetical protein
VELLLDEINEDVSVSTTEVFVSDEFVVKL